MSSKYYIIILLLIFLFSNCEKYDTPDNPFVSVEKYINQLKNDSYNKSCLPDLNPEDIPALLNISKDTTEISNFPRNPLSSCFQQYCKIGFIALWTIESIRIDECENITHCYDLFPSLNATIYTKKDSSNVQSSSNSTLFNATDAYSEWWNSNKNFDKIKKTNPLEGTNYSW